MGARYPGLSVPLRVLESYTTWLTHSRNLPMPMTLAEKIVARAAGRSHVVPGEIVTCAVDLAMIHDSGGPRRVVPILKRFGVGLWDPNKVVLISDHYIPANDDETRRIGEVTRKF